MTGRPDDLRVADQEGTPDDLLTDDLLDDPSGELVAELTDQTFEDPDPRLAPDAAETAAAAALQRARSVARAKGLRPGSRPRRRRRPAEILLSGTGVDAAGRDPLLLGDTLAHLVAGRGWQSEVKVGSVIGRWPQVVGSEVAEHSEPLTFDDGILTVRASSTAWATQLRLMTSTILGRLTAEVGEGVVEQLRVVGPGAPRWSRGRRRSTDGRGPRDTYG
ncbi:DUF721 domain-containing protein [Arsenicicoccus dermatophilus]|uniref:DUF721 domain-containing protein n=1 Tax=Arsenicicoccus dermatophilus TaxID=1076331 RepID=UPI0039171BA6